MLRQCTIASVAAIASKIRTVWGEILNSPCKLAIVRQASALAGDVCSKLIFLSFV